MISDEDAQRAAALDRFAHVMPPVQHGQGPARQARRTGIAHRAHVECRCRMGTVRMGCSIPLPPKPTAQDRMNAKVRKLPKSSALAMIFRPSFRARRGSSLVRKRSVRLADERG